MFATLVVETTACSSAQLHLGEVRGVVAAVPGEQPIGVRQRMRPDDEVGDDVLPGLDAGPAAVAVEVLRGSALRGRGGVAGLTTGRSPSPESGL